MKKRMVLPAVLTIAGAWLQLPVSAAAAPNSIQIDLPSFDFGSLFSMPNGISDMNLVLAGMACLLLMMLGGLLVLAVAILSGKRPDEDEQEEMPVTPAWRYPDPFDGETAPLRSHTRQTEDKPHIDGVIEILSGPMRGCMIPIHHGETLYFGKNPRVCNVIFPCSYTKVSRMHCMISYDAALRRYYVIDTSTNGTYVSGRTRLNAGEKTALMQKTVLTLADDSCTVLLG